MSFPASLTTRTVKGRFVTYPDGTPTKGFVRVVLNDLMQGPTDDTFVSPFDITLPFDLNGEISCVLPANNDPQWSRSHYTIYINTEIGRKKDLSGLYKTVYKTKQYRLEVPYDATSDLDLADILNVGSPIAGELYVVRSQLGLPNGIATLGPDGKVTPAQLPASSGGAVEWDDIEGKPSTFPADPPTWSAITGKPTTFPAAVAWSDVSGKPSTFPSTPAWTDVTGKPTTFPHDPITWDEVTGKPDLSGGGSITWDAVTSKPTTFPPQTHTHAELDVVGLQTSLDGKSDVGHTHSTSDVTSLDTTLASKATVTALTSGLAAKTDVGHTHAESDISGLTADLAAKATTTALTNSLSTKSDVGHAHTEADISGLTADLAAKATTTALTTGLSGKANTSHTHAQSDITGLATALSTKADTSSVTTSLASKADLVGGVIPTAQLPAIAVIDFLGSVASQTAMLALTGQKGDWCIRTDLGQTWVITGSDPTALASWTAMPLASVPVQTVNGQTGTVVLGKTDVGLGNVDNTSDTNKPVSTAQQTALNAKAPLASPTFTGTVSGVTAAMVGLGNVDNTSDANKPVSTAQAAALALKAPLASPALTGTPTAPTQTAGDNTTAIATTAFVTTADNLKAPLASPTFTGTPAAPTATAGTSTTQLATTAFVTTADNLKAPLASPTFTGTPAAPTAAAGTSTTQVATTAFVAAAITAAVSAKVIVLGPVDAVPGGTPAGTVIVRTAS